MMFRVYKCFLPEVAVGYEDPRVQVHISNGVEFMKTVPQGTYDTIMLDAFQNMGPTSKELSDIFLESVARALRPGDVMSTPADSFWHKDFVHCADTIANCRKIFRALSTMPGQQFMHMKGKRSFAIRTSLWDNGVHAVRHRSTLKIPSISLTRKTTVWLKGPPKFYNTQMHNAAFQVPCFVDKALGNQG
ncbi:unnamed protein product [Prunus armeniaca]|uniref:PABS domain-containing protein n=1 Tax=Prunus armeniaca TaxID=36596 RepID=A0A6J5XH08_PRUAR|nr:unnamed protein product [Prunus armeniaca]